MTKRRPTAQIVAALAAMGMAGCVTWNPDDPRLVRGETPSVYMNCSNTAAAFELTRFDLESNLGRPFPDLTLMTLDKQTVRLSSFRGKRLAVLNAAWACPTAVLWMKELEEQHWAVPAGFDELLLLVAAPHREVRRFAKSCPKAFIVGWPLEGYLAVVRFTPILYEVGADGTFEGYRTYREFKSGAREYVLGTWAASEAANGEAGTLQPNAPD